MLRRPSTVPLLLSDPGFLGAITALGVGLLLAGPMMRLCRAMGWVDMPDHRKHHEGAVPLAGGLLIGASVLIASLVVAPALLMASYHFWLGASMVLAIGFADDRFPIRARFRFAVQLGAALVFVLASGAVPTDLGQLFGPFVLGLGLFGLPFAMIGIAGLTNAFNMMDGLDGLAGGLAVIALSWLLLAFALIEADVSGSASMVASAQEAMLLIALLIGALLAFLAFNQRAPWRRRAAMFLGDGGSNALGFLVAAMSIYVSFSFGPYGMTPITAAWIAAVPLADMFTSMLVRAGEGKTPMTPDRRHMHHLLVALGMRPGRAVVLLQAVAASMGLVGVACWRLAVPEYVMFWGLFAVFAIYYVVSQRAWRNLVRGSRDGGSAPESEQGATPG